MWPPGGEAEGGSDAVWAGQDQAPGEGEKTRKATRCLPDGLNRLPARRAFP